MVIRSVSRRDFLRTAALGLGLAATGPLVQLAGIRPAHAAALRQEEVTLEFWEPPTSANPDEDKRFWDDLNARFTAETKIKVNFQYIPWDQVYNKWVAAIASGAVPDLTTSGSEATIQFAAEGHVLPVDDLIQELGGEEAFWPSISYYKWNGHIWGVPYIEGSWIQYYRKDLLEAAGLDHPPQNWDELVSAAKLLTKDDVYGLVISYAKNYGPQFPLYMMMYSNGGAILDKDGKVVFNSPQNKQALQLMADLYLTHKVVPPESTNADFAPDSVYGNGKGAMMWNYMLQAARLKKQFPEIYEKTGFDLIPAGPTGIHPSFGATNPIWIFSKSRYPEEAKAYIKFFMRPENLKAWIKESGWLPPLRSLARDADLAAAGPWWEVAIKALDNTIRTGFVYGAHPGNGVVEGRFFAAQMIQDMVVNGRGADEVLADYHQQFEEIYAKYATS